MQNPSRPPLSYRDSGVDIDAGNALVERIKPFVRRTLRPEVVGGIGGFGALFRLDLQRWKEPLMVSGTDGVGTKLMFARKLGRHDTIGIDLVAMCVNDILTCGAEPMFFLDYFAAGKLDVDVAEMVIAGIAEGCMLAGCSLIGGETAEMPGMYATGDYDLAGFAVGIVERSKLLDGGRIEPGHRILGMASSGPHSNGFSLIRKIVESETADMDSVLENPDGTCVSLGEALLAPTTIYVKPILEILESGGIDGLAHITGGGITENIVRVLPGHTGLVVDTGAWARPAVFEWLQQRGQIEENEMLRTFNCGIGMVMVAAPDHADSLIRASTSRGIPCHDIGYVCENIHGKRVSFIA